MSEELTALVGDQCMGHLIYDPKKDLLSFRYESTWMESSKSIPLSLSMPITKPEHPDSVVRPFLTGLLPDNDEILERWGKRYQVSARNPFRLLNHVGEECAGAVQFVRPERASSWLAGAPPQGVTWLDDQELAERITDLCQNHAATRRLGDQGQFSLAGAQPKIGLFRDPSANRWGIPKGETPTTHILKPNAGTFAHYDQNEHFCLRLTTHLGLPTATSWIEEIGGIPVIVVERYDRTLKEGKTIRVHQEDTCQALSIMPGTKYQKDGGPSAADIFSLIRNYSSRPRDDEQRFLDALIFNWLILGTDAHAKNYSFLLAAGLQVRLAPLYDLSSVLPYPREIQFQKAKLAMKIGGEYKLAKVGPHQWEKAAKEWKLKHKDVVTRIVTLASALPPAAEKVASEMPTTPFLTQLVDCLRSRAKACLNEFTS
jgi:serine/threonine-protein kinase HipA